MNSENSKYNIMELLIKILALVAVVLYFLPLYMFSMNFLGYNAAYNISFCSLTFGITNNGQQIMPGQFGYIFALLLPIFIFAFVQFVRHSASLSYGLSLVSAVVDLIIIIASTIQGTSEDFIGLFGYGVTPTFWLIMNYIVIGLVIIFCIVLLVKKRDDVGNEVRGFSRAVSDATEKAASTKNSTKIKGACSKCGAELAYKDVFCPKCGERYVAPEPKTCTSCGARMDEDEVFCHKCGKKYEEPINRICPSCGAKAGKDTLFCGKCGTSLIGNDKPAQEEKAQEIKEKATQQNPVEESITQSQPNITFMSEGTSTAANMPMPGVNEEELTVEKKVTEYVGSDRLICPYCGKDQMKERCICYNCGKDLIKDDKAGELLNMDVAQKMKPISKTENFIFCSRCGAKNDKDATFCDKCGSKID